MTFLTKIVVENTKAKKASPYQKHEDYIVKIGILGSGWLAQPLAKQLQLDSHQILLTTTHKHKVSELQAGGLKALQYELGDQLSDPAQLFKTDVMIIAITSKDLEAFDILLDQLSEHHCKHLIYISSTAVYQNNQQIHDETSQNLNKDSPIWKIEQLIQTHSSSTVIRFAGLVGPGRHPGRFFADGRILKNPTAPVNLIHLDDCIGIIKAVIDKGIKNEIFNGCADTHPPKNEFYAYMAELLKLTEPQFENSSSGSYKTIDNQKIQNKLGYKLNHPDVLKMTF